MLEKKLQTVLPRAKFERSAFSGNAQRHALPRRYLSARRRRRPACLARPRHTAPPPSKFRHAFLLCLSARSTSSTFSVLFVHSVTPTATRNHSSGPATLNYFFLHLNAFRTQSTNALTTLPQKQSRNGRLICCDEQITQGRSGLAIIAALPDARKRVKAFTGGVP